MMKNAFLVILTLFVCTGLQAQSTWGQLSLIRFELNEDPYGNGWIVKIKPSDPMELEDLMSADAYKEMVG